MISYFAIVFVLPLYFFTADRLTQLVEMSDNRAGGREFEPWRGQHSGSLRASLCKILISSFAHKMDFANNFSVDFF